MLITSDKLTGLFWSVNERAYYNSDYITNELIGYTIRIPYWSIENHYRDTLKLIRGRILSKKYRVQINNPLVKQYYDEVDFIDIMYEKFIDVRMFGKEFMDKKDSLFSIDKNIYLGDALLRGNKYYFDENKVHHMLIHDGLIVAPLSNEDLRILDKMTTTYGNRNFGKIGENGYFKNRFYLRIEFNDSCPGLQLRPAGPIINVKENTETYSKYYLDNIKIDVNNLFSYLEVYSEYIETIYVKIYKDIKFIYNNCVLDYDAFINYLDRQNKKVILIE